jgi:hypothetical protein
MKKRILASILAAVTMATCAFSTVACSEQKELEEQVNAGLEQTYVGGGMQIGEGNGSGIQLMRTTLLSSEYGDYGVSATAESAYTLTATVTPSDAGNQGVDWSLAWSNPSATWANGKTVTDYVTVVPTTSGAKTATVSCLQPFGTQIIITATSQDNPNAKATCTVDYAQKVTSVELNFGNVPINLGGDTFVKYELSSSATGPGGEIYADIQTNDVYTISENFTSFVDMTYLGTGSESVYFSLKTGHPTGMDFMNRDEITNWYGEEVYFDYNHDICNWFVMTRAGDVHFNTLTTAEIIKEFEGMKEDTMYAITFNVAGAHSSYSYTSTMKCNGYTNSTPIKSLSVDHNAFVF